MHALLIALSLVYGATETKVYRYTDENGVVHYTTSPTEAERDLADQVTVRTHAGSTDAATAEEAADEADDLAEPEEPKVDFAKIQRQREQARRVNCEQGRLMVDSLKTSGRVRIQFQDGSERWVHGDERVAELRKAQRIVAEYC